MKKFYFGAMIALAATAFLSSCEKNGTESEPVALSTPVLTVVEQTESSFMVIWDLVENAVSYTYTINNGTEESTTNESAQFTDLTEGTYTVKVKAVAPEGDEFIDSDWASINVTLEGEDNPDNPDTGIDGQYTANVDGVDVVYEIVSDGGEYKVFPLTYISGDEAYYTATLSDNALTVSLTGIDVNVEGMGLVSVIMCGYHTDPEDGELYLWPDENCVLEFGEDSFTATNGIFLGFNASDGKWYNWTGSTQEAGTVFTKTGDATGSQALSLGAAVASSASMSSVAAR